MLIITLGFFLFETSWITMHHESSTNAMIVHHIFTIAAVTVVLYVKEGGAEACAVLFGTEISTPLLILRWYMRDAKYNGACFFVVEAVFAAIFIFMRLILGTFYAYHGLFHPNTKLLFNVITTPIYLVSCIFAKEIVQVTGHHVKKTLIFKCKS